MLLGSFTTALGPARIVVRAGITVPLGSTEDNPFTAEAEVSPHQHVQMGAGTFRPVIAADVSVPRGKWRFCGFLFTQQALYETRKRAGQNTKSKRHRLKSKRATRLRVERHRLGPCGNIGCKKCNPGL